MAKARLFTAACAAALLAAAPALAQNSTNPADAGSTPPAMPQATPGQTGQTGTHSHMGSRSTHRSAMERHHGGAMGPNAQNSEVDRLNQQSYEAAQRGQNFTPGSGSMSTAPSGGGSMNDMGGGSMGGAPAGGGGMGGAPAGGGGMGGAPAGGGGMGGAPAGGGGMGGAPAGGGGGNM